MKLWFIMGTAAELIKIFPVIQEAEKAKIPWYLWSTGQGSTNFWMQYEDLQLPKAQAFCLDDKARDLETSLQAIKWMTRNIARPKSWITKEITSKIGVTPQKGDIAVVHGDTFSTFLGATYAKRLGLRLAHVEAGMRSGDIFNPFPEEINRRLVSRWADFHFAPDTEAATHLHNEKRTGEIIVTGGNSVYDALISTLNLPRPSDLPTSDYVLANLHRFENLQSNDRWNVLIDTLVQTQKKAPVFFVMHPPTEARLSQDTAAQKRLKDAGVSLLNRQSYTRFVHLLAGAKFVLTDGGSNQTECAYLGLPCLILREKTELVDGIGANCILSQFNQKVIEEFLSDTEKFKKSQVALPRSPSQKIIQVISENQTLLTNKDMPQ